MTHSIDVHSSLVSVADAADMLSPRVQQTPRTARSVGAASPFAPLAAGVPSLEDGGGGVPDEWDGVCEWVLGKRAALWDQLFEQAFLQASPGTLQHPSCMDGGCNILVLCPRVLPCTMDRAKLLRQYVCVQS